MLAPAHRVLRTVYRVPFTAYCLPPTVTLQP
jgi:hypothetical protein